MTKILAFFSKIGGLKTDLEEVKDITVAFQQFASSPAIQAALQQDPALQTAWSKFSPELTAAESAIAQVEAILSLI